MKTTAPWRLHGGYHGNQRLILISSFISSRITPSYGSSFLVPLQCPLLVVLLLFKLFLFMLFPFLPVSLMQIFQGTVTGPLLFDLYTLPWKIPFTPLANIVTSMTLIPKLYSPAFSFNCLPSVLKTFGTLMPQRPTVSYNIESLQ